MNSYLQKMSAYPEDLGTLSPAKKFELEDIRRSGNSTKLLCELQDLIYRHPTSALLWELSGQAAFNNQNLELGLLALEECAHIRSDDHLSNYNLGVARELCGLNDGAKAAFMTSIKLNPNFANAHNSLGRLHKASGMVTTAEQCFRTALDLDKHHVAALNNLGLLLLDQNSVSEADQLLNRALALNPDDYRIRLNISITRRKLGYPEDALAHIRSAIQLKPKNEVAYVMGCQLLESMNRLKDLEKLLVSSGAQLNPLPEALKVIEAKLKYRQKDYRVAAELATDIDALHLPTEMQIILFNLRGQICDKLGEFTEAFRSFKEMNEARQNTAVFKALNPSRFLGGLEAQVRSPEQLLTLSDPLSDVAAPIFLVGFPRSGTTLLDSILRSHSQIKVLEESPSLDKAEDFLTNWSPQDASGPSTFHLERRRGAIAAYFQEALGCITDRQDDLLLVDKYPLNITKVPLIEFLFPNAKIILVLRHPRDCVLSSWMQNFALNPAMACLTNIHTAGHLYDLCMSHFHLHFSDKTLTLHKIKYEDVITDLRSSVEGLLEFIGVEWQENLTEFYNTAKNRVMISTPSYSQVIEPVHSDSLYRWKHYDDAVTQWPTALNQWATKFGY
ncbi:sulfotransferase [Luminiphilus sp.]|nr:sulfotransferase [Luminiphilus sp.]